MKLFETFIRSDHRRFHDGETLPYSCFEKDSVPVDTDDIFEDQCVDKTGNKFDEGSSLTSCCQCIM